jgi:hypothetical protein
VNDAASNVTRRLHKTVRRTLGGIDLASDVDAVISVNTGGSSSTTTARSVQSTAISQTGSGVSPAEEEER